MRLEYIYIEKYRNLENFQANLGGENIYNFDYKKKKMSITDNICYVEDFYSNNIQNISAIVGSNGSGKTNLLHFLFHIVTFKVDATCNFMLIYKIGDTRYAYCSEIYNNLFKKSNITFTNTEPKELEDLSNVYFRDTFEMMLFNNLDNDPPPLMEINTQEFFNLYNKGNFKDFDINSIVKNIDENSDISDLSCGEFKLYSIFLGLINLHPIINKSKNFLLILDISDHHLHPDWQKLFIKNLVDFTSNIFKDSSVQIILTTHSPFIISDLPKWSVVPLKKIKRNNPEISDDRTFGANISKILYNDFFLENTTGEFSMEVMKCCIEILNKKHINKKNHQKVKKILDNIGEPFIRTKLMSMLERLKIK